MARQKNKICPGCNVVFKARNATTCSTRCRMRLHRLKSLATQEAQNIGESAQQAFEFGKNTLKSLESTLSADLLPVADTEAGFIGNTSTPTLQTPPPTPAMPMAKMAISGSLAPQTRPIQAVTPRPAAVPRPPSIPIPSPLPPLTATTAAVNDLRLSAQAHPPHIPPSAGSLIQPQAREATNPLTSTQPLTTTSLPGSTPPQVFSLQSTPSSSVAQAPAAFSPTFQTPQHPAAQSATSAGLPPLVPDTPKSPWTSWFKTRPYAVAAGFVALIVIGSGVFGLSKVLHSGSTPSTANLSFQTTDNSILSTTDSVLTLNLDTVIATGKTLTLGQLTADPTTGVLLLSGDLNASGTLLASGGATSLNNDGLTIDNNLVCTADGCIGTGTGAAAAGIPATTTLQGNTFNGANQLVQLTAGGLLPALNGSNLTALNATNISSGTLSDSRLSSTVTLQGNSFNLANELVQLNSSGALPVLSGINLTALNAANISSGTLADARLSANVALLAGTGPQTFSGNNRFSVDSTTAFQIQN
ncbi:hypothetical protein HYS42_00375, partial [Candidatus Saccharibacteria bacterium]|nr:hypothetical protein [Candidatus Saccharibacteria bacterium]